MHWQVQCLLQTAACCVVYFPDSWVQAAAIVMCGLSACHDADQWAVTLIAVCGRMTCCVDSSA